MKESVKIDKATVTKVRRHVKKSKQTIGGFFELMATVGLSENKNIALWKEKSDKWDALDNIISEFYPEDDNGEIDGDLADIGEIAARAFGYL